MCCLLCEEFLPGRLLLLGGVGMPEKTLREGTRTTVVLSLLRNSWGLASKSWLGGRLPETVPPLKLAVLMEKMEAEYGLRLKCCLLGHGTGFIKKKPTSFSLHSFCGNNRTIVSHPTLVSLAHFTKPKFVLQYK